MQKQMQIRRNKTKKLFNATSLNIQNILTMFIIDIHTWQLPYINFVDIYNVQTFTLHAQKCECVLIGR